MHNSVRRLMALLGATAAAFAVSAGPAAAGTGEAEVDVTTGPCAGELSPATLQAWENWDTGGGMLGQGAAMLISGAWVGAPHSILDLALENGEVSPATAQAWENWDIGGGLAGEGAARMVSGAWVGAPQSILDLIERAACGAGGAGLTGGGSVDAPVDVPDLP